MRQSLPVQSQAEAVFPHQSPMPVDGFQMTQNIHGLHLAAKIQQSQYTTGQRKKREKLFKTVCAERDPG